MGSQTAKGYPYPVGSDRVMDGDNAIQALAEAVDTRTGVSASGTATISISAAASGSVTVTFPAGRFTVPPSVVHVTNSFNYIPGANTPSASAIVLYAGHRAGTASSIVLTTWWIARQE
jgi:hypothetical protein